MKVPACFFFLFFLGMNLSGQIYEFGQDPSSLKWKKLDTDHFRIIYPVDFSDKAQTLARLMEKSRQANMTQLEHKSGKISLIIHNQSVYPNAFVSWAPKRMEFFTFPDPDLYPGDWLHELSLHEYRHVSQIRKVNQGFTRFLGYFIGQQATGAVAGMMPFWFIEGDAVSAETSLSDAGRGNLPSFEMQLKTILLSTSKYYSFSKAYLGSYKDMVPDHYELGYQMVSYSRKFYGKEYWTDALNYIGKHPYLLSPYYFYSLKKTGGGQNLLYKNTMNYLREHWKESAKTRDIEDIKSVNIRRGNIYTSYTNPVFYPDSSIIALKNSMDQLKHFVKISPDGSEEKLFTPGSLVSGKFSQQGNKIIWDEYESDIRWSNRSYSVLKEFDISTGTKRKMSSKSKYIFPAYSPDGDSIVAVETGTDYNFSLVILNKDGILISQVPSPGNAYLQSPEWIGNTGKIAVISSDENGKSIWIYNLNTQKWTKIFDSGFVNISQLKADSEFLVFTAGFSGIDQIYSYNLKDNELRKITSTKFGAFYPQISGNKEQIVYSSYGLKGNDVIVKPFKKDTPEFLIPDTITGQSFSSVSLKKIKESNTSENSKTLYEETPYRKASHLINIHSWAPYWFDYMDPSLDDIKVSPGITLLSQNELSTAIGILGYQRYNGKNYLHTGFTYKGLWPVFEFRSTYGGNAYVVEVKDVASPDISTNLYSTLNTYLPLMLTSGRFITGLQPSLQASYSSTSYFNFADSVYQKGNIFISPGLFFYSYKRLAIRDLQPSIGIVADGRFSAGPFHPELFGNIKSLSLVTYLPGLLKNQGLKLKAEWQKQKVTEYYFNNLILLPRGYSQKLFLEMNHYSAEYAFPIIYPDLELASLIYLKRIRGDFFIDYMKGREKYEKDGALSAPSRLMSQGIELYADYHILRFILEFNSGVRFSYMPYEKRFITQILFNINLDKF